jgi:DNA-binding NarL/FixJ family response regulator
MLADDHVLFTDAIVRLLAGRCEVVDTVADGANLVDAATRHRPDVIVMDISMPSLSGIEAMRRLKAIHNESRVIFLTMHADPKLATEALRLGAKGFVLKQSSGEELLNAIEAVLQGQTFLTPILTADVVTLTSRPADSAAVTLSSRQKEVLRLVANGLTMKGIAANLDLSPRTVEAIKYEMMHVLDLHSTAQLVRYAIEHRLVAF